MDEPPPLTVTRAHVGHRTAVLSILGFWAFYFVLNSIRMGMDPLHVGELWAMTGKRSVVVLIGMGMTYLMYLVMRWVEGRSTLAQLTTAFLASIPVATVYGIINFTAFYVVDPLDSVRREVERQGEQHESAIHVIADAAVSWYFFIAAWAVLYVALSYAARVRHAERSTALYRAEAQTAQLRALRYQVNPHFLFNTLNALSTLVLQRRTDDAERMIGNLSTFFRNSLARDLTEDVPLSEEIRLQRLYLDIEQVRFPERLIVVVDVPAELHNVMVPGLILQPIVENAIKHGVARTNAPVTIAIRAHADGDMLRLTVEDDAIGDGRGPAGQGVGLKNVCDRLAMRFQTGAGCTAGPRPEGGYRVELTIPLGQ